MTDEGMGNETISRRGAIKTALRAGVYTTPVILAVVALVSNVAAVSPAPIVTTTLAPP